MLKALFSRASSALSPYAVYFKLALVAVIALVVIYAVYAHGRIDTLSTQNDTLQGQYNASQQALSAKTAQAFEIQGKADRNVAELAKLRRKTAQATAEANERRKEILNVSPDQDKPISPVMLNVLLELNRLRRQAADPRPQ